MVLKAAVCTWEKGYDGGGGGSLLQLLLSVGRAHWRK